MRHKMNGKSAKFLTSLLLITVARFSVPRNSTADPSKVGIEIRAAWTTSRIMGSPEPPLPYVTEQAFPALKFNQCLDIVSEP